MSLANWNVKEKEKFSVVADPVFCFSFSFLSFFFVIFFEKRFSVGQSLYSFDFKVWSLQIRLYCTKASSLFHYSEAKGQWVL